MLQVKAVYVCNKILDFEGTLYNSVDFLKNTVKSQVLTCLVLAHQSGFTDFLLRTNLTFTYCDILRKY